MIYKKNMYMYITCVVIDHRQNLTIHLSIGNQTYPNRQKFEKGREELDYVEEYQIYLNKQNVGKKNETGQITSENIKLI